MSVDRPFKRLERKAYVSYHRDGLIDLVLGMAAVGFGMNLATDSVVWNMFAWLPIIFYVPLKNRITVPRLGYVSFGSTASGRNRRLVGFLSLGVLFLLLAGLVIFLLPIFGRVDSPMVAWIRSSPLLFFGLAGAVGFGVGGAISGIRRLTTYAVLCSVLMIAGHVLGLAPYIPILLLAAALFTVGAILMIRFMRKYPLAGAETSDETG